MKFVFLLTLLLPVLLPDRDFYYSHDRIYISDTAQGKVIKIVDGDTLIFSSRIRHRNESGCMA